ncbi:unnamed protein product [Echinostoma caproni]|uniref:WD_REPEATS_REGION domain-containing protein n=1 Tax=Echinostoma caproni TaxID=27848 RepID=A0A183ATS7_9TREM|nr:unnamed protein product [Echinostoma caproni]
MRAGSGQTWDLKGGLMSLQLQYQVPRRKMFQPLNTSKTRITQKTKETGGMSRKLERVYQTSEKAPSILCRSGPVDSDSTPIYQIAYSPFGGHIATALGNAMCLVLRTPSRDEREIPSCAPATGLPTGEALRGHKSPVLSISWSTTGQLLLTSSADRTARMWSMKTQSVENGTKTPPRTVLILDSISGGASNGYGEQTTIRSGNFKVIHTSYECC